MQATTRLIWSRGGAREQMGRNGDALEARSLIRNTVRDTRTRAVLVQESMWNHLNTMTLAQLRTLLATMLGLILSFTDNPLIHFQMIIGTRLLTFLSKH